MSKHLEVRQNSLLDVWKCDETLSLVFDNILHTKQYVQLSTCGENCYIYLMEA